MPDGSDVKVRAEIQMDRDLSDSSHCCIMIGGPVPMSHHDGYNSSGSSDSELEEKHLKRKPRNGHTVGFGKTGPSLHGEKEDTQQETKRYLKTKQVSKHSENKKQPSRSTKPKHTKRRKSDEYNKEKKLFNSDFKQTQGVAQYWKAMKEETEPENIENKKSEYGKALKQNLDSENIKVDKELTDNNEDKMEKADTDCEIFEEVKDMKYILQDAVDSELGKSLKENINQKQCMEMKKKASKKIETEQTEMLEKQKLKKTDYKNLEKTDQEKDIDEVRNIDKFDKDELKTKKENGQQEKDLENQKTMEVDLGSSSNSYSHEKLVVNIDQRKNRQKDAEKLGPALDNKLIDYKEKCRDQEQTGLKQVLDPQLDEEIEKQDVSREVAESYKTNDPNPIDRESSFGFEVRGRLDELIDTNSSLYQRLEYASKLLASSQNMGEMCSSVDEHSCSFSSECEPSTDSFKSFLSNGKETLDIRQSCPDFERMVYQMDSNRRIYDLNILMKCSWVEREALSEQNKIKILETVEPKSNKELELETSERKLNKEEIDGNVEKDIEYDIESEKVDSAVEKELHGDDDSDYGDDADEGEDEAGDQKEVTNNGGEQNAWEDSENNSPADACFRDASNNDFEQFEIIDAEEKDADEKEIKGDEKKLPAGEMNVDAKRHIEIDRIERGEMEEEESIEAAVTLKDPDKIVSEEKTDRFGLLHVDGTEADFDHLETGMALFRKMTKVKGSGNRRFNCKVGKKEKMRKTINKKQDFWNKAKKIPKPTLPKNKDVDKLEPIKNWNGRRYSVFAHGQFGRQCSGNTGGKGGNGGGNTQSGGNSNQRNNGEKDSKNRRNRNNRDGDSGDRNNNNKQNQNRDNNSFNKGTEQEIADTPEVSRGLEDVIIPPADFKGNRKKHTDLEDLEWLNICCHAVEENKGPVDDLFLRLRDEQIECVQERLNHPEELPDDGLNCSICITVDSLLKHYAHCLSVFNSCDMCVKSFSLTCSHVTNCLSNPERVCEIRICRAIRVTIGGNISSHKKTLWFQVRRKLARIFDDAEEDGVEQLNTPDEGNGRPRPKTKLSASLSGPLPSIPEGTTLSLTSTSRSGSRVLRRKKSGLTNVEEGHQSGVSEDEGSSASQAIYEAAGAEGVVEDEEGDVEEVDSKHGLYSRPEIPDEADAIPTSSEDGSVSTESTGSGNAEGSGQFGVVTAMSRFTSLPMGPPGHGEPYFPSFKEKPSGKKGIGEVVYANKHQLVVVVTIWEKYKTQYQIEAKLARHYTEEGVILADFKSKLHIKGLRYQNEFQWIKVAHLGNGMTGKCHLATDFETDFKFCVKEIHISNYEKEEIELWSELDNPFIVQVYGAIRHGEKIYILQEFIEGGCLTEAINIQRKLGRRLSQLTALKFFQQLLQVLKYLKSRNILHEDLKADNILMNKTSDGVSIKVADFGLARRCQGQVRGGTTPVGTQTQWSPEKAEARVGYGFGAEIWAAVCVLVHMLSGLPPWMKRYENFKALIVVIVEKSPPIEDIPRNIHESIKDLIKRGFTVCQGQRPTAEELLNHHAFRLLDDAQVLQSTSGTYSILESVHIDSHTNRIDDDPNADLREIYRNLERESAEGATGTKNGARRKDSKVSSIIDVHGEELPFYSKDYRIYAVENSDKIVQPSLEEAITGVSNTVHEAEEQMNTQEAKQRTVSSIYTRLPSHPNDNVNPMGHIDRFYNDEASPTVPFQAEPNLVRYQPNLESIGSQKGNNSSHESSLENLSTGTVTEKLIPKFDKILTLDSGEEVPNIAIDVSDDEGKEDDILSDFNLEKYIKHVQENNIPTVINSSADLSPGSKQTSRQGSISPGIPASIKDSDDGKVKEKLVQENAEKSRVETETKTLQTGVSSGHSIVGDDHIQSFTDDDLFKSGSPPKFYSAMFTHTPGQGHFSTIHEAPGAPKSLLLERNNEFQVYGESLHKTLTPGRERLVGASLPPLIENASKSPQRLPHSAIPYSMQSYVLPQSDMHQNLRASPTIYTKELQQFQDRRVYPAQRSEQGRGNIRPDTYMPNDNEQQHNWFYSPPSMQQQTAVPTTQQQYLSPSPNNNTMSPGMTTSSLSAQKLRSSPRLYPSSLNMEVPRHQLHQGQQMLGQGQFSLQGQGFNHQPTSVQSYQGGNHTHLSNQREIVSRQNQPHLRAEMQNMYTNSNMYTNPYMHTSPNMYANTQGLASMPTRYVRPEVTGADPLYTSHLYPYQTSTPRRDGYQNGTRPKVPGQQQPKQLFTASEHPSYISGRASALPSDLDLKINDPRKVYEQSSVAPAGRNEQFPVNARQPKTPILNPVINPRPVTPQEGHRLGLRLDINRAQQVPEVSVLSHVQTAPVFSPPKTPKKSPDLHRAMSQVPIACKSPSIPGMISGSSSLKDERMSSSASKSQFEEQNEAFRELGRTAEEALSQHSDHASRIFFTEYDDDVDEQLSTEYKLEESNFTQFQIQGEIDDRYLENPAESLAYLLDVEQDNSVTVTFRSASNGKEFSMKFSPKHTTKTWEKIVKEELDGFSAVCISDFALKRFCLKRQNGHPIDLDSCLGNSSCTVMMVEAKDNDPWWIEGGMISQ